MLSTSCIIPLLFQIILCVHRLSFLCLSRILFLMCHIFEWFIRISKMVWKSEWNENVLFNVRQLLRKIGKTGVVLANRYLLYGLKHVDISIHNASCSLICCGALTSSDLKTKKKSNIICLSSVYRFAKETEGESERPSEQEKVPRQLSNFSWHNDTNICVAYTFSHLIFNSFRLCFVSTICFQLLHLANTTYIHAPILNDKKWRHSVHIIYIEYMHSSVLLAIR